MPITIDLNALLNDPQVTSLIRIVIAGLVGGLIGLERELAGKPAGIRTYGLVSMGAAMFACVAVFGFNSLDFGSRIVGSIITGIGFLGAGTILHTRLHVVGLTTAAGMWVAAGVGMAVGLGMYVVGVGAGLLLFVLLQFASPEELIQNHRRIKGKLDAAELDEIAEQELEERLRQAPRPDASLQVLPPLPPPAPQQAPAPPTLPASPPAWPTAAAAAVPVYGPWSTTAQPRDQVARR